MVNLEKYKFLEIHLQINRLAMELVGIRENHSTIQVGADIYNQILQNLKLKKYAIAFRLRKRHLIQ